MKYEKKLQTFLELFPLHRMQENSAYIENTLIMLQKILCQILKRSSNVDYEIAYRFAQLYAIVSVLSLLSINNACIDEMYHQSTKIISNMRKT